MTVENYVNVDPPIRMNDFSLIVVRNRGTLMQLSVKDNAIFCISSGDIMPGLYLSIIQPKLDNIIDKFLTSR